VIAAEEAKFSAVTHSFNPPPIQVSIIGRREHRQVIAAEEAKLAAELAAAAGTPISTEGSFAHVQANVTLADHSFGPSKSVDGSAGVGKDGGDVPVGGGELVVAPSTPPQTATGRGIAITGGCCLLGGVCECVKRVRV
jgi:hypothetical protein